MGIPRVCLVRGALRVAAERYITADQDNLELERTVGRVMRAFDPYIACATHKIMMFKPYPARGGIWAPDLN